MQHGTINMDKANNEESENSDFSYRLKAGAFLAFTGGFGMFAGFASALGQAKKQDPQHFDKGMTGYDAAADAATKEAVKNLDNAALEKIRHERALHESGAALARRALGICTKHICRI